MQQGYIPNAHAKNSLLHFQFEMSLMHVSGVSTFTTLAPQGILVSHMTHENYYRLARTTGILFIAMPPPGPVRNPENTSR